MKPRSAGHLHVGRHEAIYYWRVEMQFLMAEWFWAMTQTVVVFAGFLFTGYQFRESVKAQRYKNYLDAVARIADTQILMAQTPVLHALYEANAQDITAEYSGLSPDQKTRVHYCDTILGLTETVWVAKKKKQVEDDEWPYWERWLVQLHASPEFRWTLSWVETDYDHEFIKKIQSTAAQPVAPSRCPPSC